MDQDVLLDEDYEDASDEACVEFQLTDTLSSPQPSSSGPPSDQNSCTSSPPAEKIVEQPHLFIESPTQSFDSTSENLSTTIDPGGSSNSLIFCPGGAGEEEAKPSHGSYTSKRGRPGRPRKEFPFLGISNIRDLKLKIGQKKCRGGVTKLSAKKRFFSTTLKEDRPPGAFNLSQNAAIYSPLEKSPNVDLTTAIEAPDPSAEGAEKSCQLIDDAPYFAERWPGKLCALCNLGERSQLGQGEMLRLEIGEANEARFGSSSPSENEKESLIDIGSNPNLPPTFINRRQKSLHKCKNPATTFEYIEELEKVGHFETLEMLNIQDGDYYYVHRCCATWSFGIQRDPTENLYKITLVVSQSLRRRCAYCNHFGASLACKMACPKFFHFPCIAASGGFQIIQTYVSFCKEHLGQIPLICIGTDDINCRSCAGLGDVSNTVMCCICGDHYHGTCIGLPRIPSVRAGWQCTTCRKCQICRVPDASEGRSLACEQCHKVYHANCLRPVMSSLPKYGWKCRRCRVCSDCGSRTPGAGASSRWHSHYTVCDSCYQQRNKGFSCPICHRAYRAAAYREMVKCSLCNKFVHSACDSEADLAIYHTKKENNPDYEYVCQPCKLLIQSGRFSQSLICRNSQVEDECQMSGLQESNCSEDVDTEYTERNPDFGLGKGKPFSAAKFAKKRMGALQAQSGRTKGKLNFQKRPRLADLGRKRGPKTKMRGIFGVPGLGLQRPTIESYNSKIDEEPGIENRLVLCSAKDKFILTQDICVMCGAIGTDHEGCLISCTQCGQCYHPYCVNVKVTKVILQKGWRCLDCTVCEGCGQKNDESRLILCDECDISFHIYCMDPPLDYVPQGNWKCKWCALCHKCGRNSPGKNCSWKNSYSECGPCASQAFCAACSTTYMDAELIIQCINCERWLHGKCDSIRNEEEAEKCDDEGYVCILCRPKDIPPPHLLPPKKPLAISKLSATNTITDAKVADEVEFCMLSGMDGTHFMDGVCLSESGLNLIKSLQMEYIRKKRKQKLVQDIANSKDDAILAAIESVVSGSTLECNLDIVKLEPLDPKEEAEIYKDGMVWDRSDSSPPEGFALCTNEQGVVVLRKKRQRNLQKVGIGGFNVRNRAVKKDVFFKDEIDENGENIISFLSTSDTPPNEKKKKQIRKKQKNKLIETYPAYLQEAFFGKTLLITNKINFESDTSDDDAKGDASDDKFIKLSPEEIKMLESMKQAQKQTVHQSPDRTKDNDQASLKSMKAPGVQALSKPESLVEDVAESDFKDIIPPELLDSDLVNSIMNDGDDLTKVTVCSMDDAARKDDLTDILCQSNFNLDSIGINSNDVEEIFQDVISTDSKPAVQQPQTTLSPASSGFPNHSIDIQHFAPVESNSNVILNQPKAQMDNFLAGEVFTNVVSSQEALDQGDQQRSAGPAALTQKCMPNKDSQSAPTTPMEFSSTWAAISSPSQHRPLLEQSMSINDELLSGQTTSAQISCTQKSSERMRKDEELGEMATISAVLYANTKHPELKTDYPNWSDRCKQIYKKWRSLSNDKKAPFLQQARDNRSALRMKKVQLAVDSDRDTDGSSLHGSCSSSIPLDGLSDNNDDDSTSRLSSCSSSFGMDSSNIDAREATTDEIDSRAENIKVIPTKFSTNNEPYNETYKTSQTQTAVTNTNMTNIGNIITLEGNINLVQTSNIHVVQQKPSTTTTASFKDAAIKKANLHKFYISSSNMNGPAPNVTVNANGAFNTSAKAVLHTYCGARPINHFLVMNKSQQKVQIDLSSLNLPLQTDKQVVIKSIINQDEANRSCLQGAGGSGRKMLQFTPAELMQMNAAEKQALGNISAGVSSATTTLYLDQNIRVLTPSEIMKTLPILPGQDASIVANDCTKYLISNNNGDQEKITSQQKSLKEQEQERQWKQLQALRAKEQQLQQFTQVCANPNTTPQQTVHSTSEQVPIPEKRNPYANLPGTPRPQFGTEIIQPTVYAGQIDALTVQQLTNDKARVLKQQESNKQLRDLLQRQEEVGIFPSSIGQTQEPTLSWNSEKVAQTLPNTTQIQQNFTNTPFREPFPVTAVIRATKATNNTNVVQVRANAFSPAMSGNIRQPFIFHRTNAERLKVRKSISEAEREPNDNVLRNHTEDANKRKAGKEGSMPEIVPTDLEKLEQEDTAVIGEVEGVGDILGGLGEDDDDELLKSLTAEMGADFNILEYADPELDALTDSDNHNLLDKLDFDDTGNETDDKLKKLVVENNISSHRTFENTQLQHQNASLGRNSVGMLIHQGKDRSSLTIQPQQQSSTVTRQINLDGIMQHQKQPHSMGNMQGTYRQSPNLPRYNNALAPGSIPKISRQNLPPPPPPYPGPPPPYPANTKTVRHSQDQPLLLEDLLEQEKREQQLQHSQQQQVNAGIIINSDIKPPGVLPGQIPGFLKSENLPRTGIISTPNWRKQAGELMHHTNMDMEAQNKKEAVNPPLFMANLQPPPTLPPDTIVTDQDHILQINYEQWLNNQSNILSNQQKFYEEEVLKLRKIRKSLNSKQRVLKKSGSELSPQDAAEFVKVSAEQAVIQKQLENARKQFRQHGLLIQDYKSKHMPNVQMSPNMQSSPITSMSPMASPSTNSQPSLLMQLSPSPSLSTHTLHATRSPLHSPSPLLVQSPSGIVQSPIHQPNLGASPYSAMQSSPRIGTPHSHADENSFSPSATPSPSHIPCRHVQSPSRITSPQHRITPSQMSQRIATSPGVASYNPLLSGQQTNKFNNPQLHQERQRIQMNTSIHQQISPLGSPQPITSPNQIHSYSQNVNEIIQSQRQMHFIQQRQIIQQRQQQANQNALNQAISKVKNQPLQSTIQGQISNPTSPLLQYSGSTGSSILINQLSNKRSGMDTGIGMENPQHQSQQTLNSPDQFLSHPTMLGNNEQQLQLQHQNFNRNIPENLDNNGRGGGLQSISGQYLPVGCYGRYGKFKLGLFGGSPIWNLSDLIQKPRSGSGEGTSSSNKVSSKFGDSKISATSISSLIKEKDLTPKSKPPDVLLSTDEMEETSEEQKSVSVNSKNVTMGGNDVVIIDSSPDDKQQEIIDYDDYQDKAFIAKEVSLNSAAQNVADNDDITVMESFASSEMAEIVSSPLESEVAEEYVLFSTDVVDYVDSDDSMKQSVVLSAALSKSDESFKDLVDVSNEENISSSKIEEKHNDIDPEKLYRNSISVVLEAELGLSPIQETPINKNLNPGKTLPILGSPPFIAVACTQVSSSGNTTQQTTISKAIIQGANIVNTGLLSRIPFTSVHGSVITSISTSTQGSNAIAAASKKVIGNDVTQTTAKVSIGNTTISVPLLKTMTLSSSQQSTSQSSQAKHPTILNVRGQKINPGTIVSLSQLQLKPASNTKIVQATVVGKKQHIPQTTSDSLNAIKQNLMHTFSYPKLSQMTLLQDMALPNKIFEDESISPESSQEQEDSEIKDSFSIPLIISKKQEETKNTDEKLMEKSVTIKVPSDQVKVMEAIKKDDMILKRSRVDVESPDQDQANISQSRSVPPMPQLSPLSQPTEMTTNMANVSEQLRTIMSSINASNINVEQKPVQNKVSASLIQDENISIDPRTSPELSQTQRQTLSQLVGNSVVIQTQTGPDNDAKTSQPQPTHTSSHIVTRPLGGNGNTLKVYLSSTAIQEKQQQMLTAQKPKVVVSSMYSNVLPATIIMTSTSVHHQHQTQPKQTTVVKTTSDTFGNMQQVASSSPTIKQIAKTLPTLVSNSYLRRSKSTDDNIERTEIPAQITGSKRYSLEVTPVPKISSPETLVLENSAQLTNTSCIEFPTKASSVTSTPLVTTSTITEITKALLSNATYTPPQPTMDLCSIGCKTSSVVVSQPSKPDDSQNNVLLKQLLQNSGSSSSSTVIPIRKVPVVRAPSLGVVSSLEAQLARPVIPPASTNSPVILATQPPQKSLQTPEKTKAIEPKLPPETVKKTIHIISRETSFISAPVAKTVTQTSSEEKLPSQEKTFFMTAAASSASETAQIKAILKEEAKISAEAAAAKLAESSILVKNELTESPSRLTPAFVLAPPSLSTSLFDEKKLIKQESVESPSLKRSFSISFDGSETVDVKTEKSQIISDTLVSSVELKKKKKREYQKNRRQMQMLNKDSTPANQKKRPRKVPKPDEDYDNYIDNLIIQLRQMPSLQVLEPLLSRNYGICPPYGTGDLSQFGHTTKDAQLQFRDDCLAGDYGCAKSSKYVDFYNTKPFGDLDAPVEKYAPTMHNDFYDQEFAPIKFETEKDSLHRYDTFWKDRDIDTPDSVVSSSSPECVVWETLKPFPGLRIINAHEDDYNGRMSPVIAVIAPKPIRLLTGIDLSIDRKSQADDKENSTFVNWKNINIPTVPIKDANVTVTLTLTSSAAEDIMGVLRDLANILHIPPPTSYQIVERTTTPPSQKLGLYRTKGKDGKEGDPIDIQTILNGAAKFCRHCDVVILNTIIRAKASEFPLLTGNNDLMNSSDELYFCSKTCYKQFKWRPTNIINESFTSIEFHTNASNNRISNLSIKQERDCNSSTSGVDSGGLKRSYSEQERAIQRSCKINKTSRMDSESVPLSVQAVREKLASGENCKVNVDLANVKTRLQYRFYSANTFASQIKYKKPSEKEINETLFRMNITVTPIAKMPEDTRQCIFCYQSGDGVADGPSRLLNFDVDKWIHLNCALWSDGVYETVNGALMNLEAALQASFNQSCTVCLQLGATIKCFKNRCGNIYHLCCAIKDNCLFYKNKTTYCSTHALKNEKENELTTLSVQRRVYVERDESRQVAAVMHHSELSNLMRVGSLIFLSVGQILPHQLLAFHTPNFIYPIGYKIIRFYWSMRTPNRRCRYICSIADVSGRPEFRVLVQEPSEDDIELRDATPKAVWQRILEPMAILRKNSELVQLFPKYVTGEDLFGLTEPAVVRILESLPGIETLTDYRFKYGRNPLLELPLAINPSGAARTEPKQKQAVGWRKPHTQRSGSSNQRLPLTPTTSVAGEVACPYSKQFVHSKSSQYKKMKQDWRNNVYLARSKIQGLGLYAARDLERHTMVIEYIGEVIRTEVSELREKQYEARNRGIYMFRLDEDRVVDATLSGGLARYINHSCNPNCLTEIVEVDREYRIIIFAKRRITRGEELSYDYKFDIEDDAHKISCMCGAPNCRKWMN